MIIILVAKNIHLTDNGFSTENFILSFVDREREGKGST